MSEFLKTQQKVARKTANFRLIYFNLSYIRLCSQVKTPGNIMQMAMVSSISRI